MIKFPNFRDDWPLAMVPVLLLILARLFVHMAGGFEADPDYAYLMNGLEVLTFYPPSFNNHPGTTLEMLAALVNLGTWLVCLPFHGMGLVRDVLSKSQFYMGANNAILVMLIAAAVLWFADRVRQVTGSMAAALAGQASLLLCFPAMIALDRVTPEPLLLAATFVLAGVLAPAAFGKIKNGERTAAAVGALLGFCIATKITALPLIPLLLLLPGWRLRKRAGLFLLGGMIFFTLPTAHHYPQMLSWMTGMATHSGSYGSGAPGLPAGPVLLERARALFGQTPEFFIAVIVYCGLLAAGPRALRRLMAVCALVVAAQLFMVLKQPEPRYLAPVVAVVALADAGIVAALLSRGAAWAAAVLALLLAGLCNNVLSTAAWAKTNHAVYIANRAVLAQAWASGCGLVSYYEAPLEVYDLDFGNQYAAYRFRAPLQELYPKGVTYDWARHSFEFFGTPLSSAQLSAHLVPARCIILVGSPLARYGASFGLPATSLTLVARSPFPDGQAVAIYRYQP